MKIIAELTDKDILSNPEVFLDRHFIYRRAARAVIKDSDGYIAVLHVTSTNYYKIPGGEIDEGEDIITGLKREVKEESGCEIENIKELGIIFEVRDIPDEEVGFIQTSYCYKADVVSKNKTEFTDREKQEGFELLWLKPLEALKIIKKCKTDDYHGKFMMMRDRMFIEEFMKE